LRRIDLYRFEYETDTTLLINEDHASGQPHLLAHYEKGGLKGQMQFAAAIPAHWSDRDLLELIFLPSEKREGRLWPTWEVPARNFASTTLFKFWKGIKPLRQGGEKLKSEKHWPRLWQTAAQARIKRKTPNISPETSATAAATVSAFLVSSLLASASANTCFQ
jgi:hypothetical protein